ncbi:hypothetical protein [Cryptosporidium parvum Iowa II]|uniref:Uncharacterized protein n=2 Tax=Cryptosporidium parvum TaxID=5807 RepID=Q5CSS7_CRYPI|nr:hypothetical protein [Cryptosporidium parvum Iowa II]EAK88443.1 hypothetical protein cgd1_1500 [Cryptosporidium parvum Iowa II]QOY43478.1 Uncharacterized protein CPATCC_0037860 [Cryptosporidium parvum]WKS76050.1 hypothetical protein CPCDC_1g1500 [Cryptosporidium sp. 43IA8]WRK30542.1 Uncharacterized protein cpbgf_1001500 [Cryptosporidium parvum]|eukprot:QOY43478.1 hypothetical protein CPATCC_000268 [Cryptosporidium parvum]
MEGGENKNHVGMNCSLDDLIRKEAPKRPNVNKSIKKNTSRGKPVMKNKKMVRSERTFISKRNNGSAQVSSGRNNASGLYRGTYKKEGKSQSLYMRRKKDFQMRTELNKNDNIPDKYCELSNLDERERIIKMIRLEHKDEDFTLQVLLDSNPIIIVNKITGVIKLNSFNCRTSSMLDVWNLLLKPLGLSLQVVNMGSDCTNWSITDGSCYMENFKDGMIVRGSGSRDTARNARFSILEQHIRQLII